MVSHGQNCSNPVSDLLELYLHILIEMDILREQIDVAKRPSNVDKRPPQVSALSLARACVSDYEAKQQLEAEINTLEQQLDQAAKLADMYREQCVQSEDELARIREENEVHRLVINFLIGSRILCFYV